MVETAEPATSRTPRISRRPGIFPSGLLRRVVIEGVRPQVDGGRFPAKATVGEDVIVEADVFADGTEAFCAALLWRITGEESWTEVLMEALWNDRWRARFPVDELDTYLFTIEAWIDRFQTWRRDLAWRLEAGQKVDAGYLAGAKLVEDAAARAKGKDAAFLRSAAERLAAGSRPGQLPGLALDEQLAARMAAYPDRALAIRYERELEVVADAARARFSTWYEIFPRSTFAGEARSGVRHGTLPDVEARLPYVAEMGFDVLYLPPIHPIGRTHRKGKNGAIAAAPDDPGSPWAIGSEEGGHKSVHPKLGTLEDLRRLIAAAKGYGIEIALDIAFQCSPDHPYLQKHPEWFRRRPDGRIPHAENPPKKYEDIYPLDFETADRQGLWEELKSIVLFWIEQEVRIFRVDNPHTKPFAFWEWLIAEIKREYPDVIFLAEAFTRPKIMYRLAKLGFTQSYTYFAWKNTKVELTEYLLELTQTPVRDFFRPSFWPNTPDILTEYLQGGGRAAFIARLVLAATLCSSYGIYGPAFELGAYEARETGSEEYQDSEKYEIKRWDIDSPDSLKEIIAIVNGARRNHPALQTNRGLRFHHVDNEQLICYSKQTDDIRDIIIATINLDPAHAESGWVELPLIDWNLASDEPYQVHDLLTDARYTWTGPRNFVLLDPNLMPAHLFVLKRCVGPPEAAEFR